MMRDRQEDRRQTDTGEGRADHCVKYRAQAEGREAEIVMGYKEKRKKRPRERETSLQVISVNWGQRSFDDRSG